ncbi:MAG: hypothetical protein GTN62_10600 [Gemmatimonadales bacterium]|nr:hypothetical protein [Gemmatimonadales bacterium]NIN12013.1 hypothetical protein [Gemmatimonadales bacterium]NIN50544.1 hypothetical protein [Gemmatimonadales bacterium]NIP08008.1 hypothetical protein [Gemmatimonadales bacterium]NIR00610.1 hypothetical protein [Gemmatimonadales bacterium]
MRLEITRTLWITTIAFTTLCPPARAQEGAFAPSDEQFLNALMRLYENRQVSEAFLPDVEALIRQKLEWEKQKIDEARRVIARTNRTALIGSIIVHLAVLVGFAAALAEFFHARQLRRQGAQLPQQELRIGLEGVAVKTTLYGLLILLIASAFYLIFVKFVYPIQVIGP